MNFVEFSSKIQSCTTSNENKLEVGTNEVNITTNVHLSRCFELKLRQVLTISIKFSNLKQLKKIPTLLTLCITGKLD